MWIPQNSVDDDRHHQIIWKCGHCKPLKKSCQFFGHFNETVCEAPRLKTRNDQPVCNYSDCPVEDSMKPTHNLYQTFCDASWNFFFVFFQDVNQVEMFFSKFPAKLCLEDNLVWCKFLSVIQYHKSLKACNQFKPLKITIRKESMSDGTERFYYVSGYLPDRIDL